MAAVTSEILNNMLRTSLTDLKSFVEVLNAELAEEGQGDENRASHKDSISQVLRSFGECEAYLKKSSTCLQIVESKINDHFNEGTLEMTDEKALHDEIEGIVKMIAGKPPPDDDNRPLPNLSVDENEISRLLENVEDILNEFHPLKFTDDGEDDQENEEEEERISARLEAMQKKAMSKLKNRMNDAGSQGDEEFASRLEEDHELTDSSDDEGFDYDSLERADGGQAKPNRQAKKNVDARLKAMWNEYKEKLANVQPLDTKQLFTQAMDDHPDVDVQNLKYFSQFNDNILELFSREALLVVGTSTSFVDPISKKNITHPVRSTVCNHIYEKDTIYGILKKKKKMRCPLLGCSFVLTVEDLVEDDDVAMRITQKSARQKECVERDTENMETEDEDSGDDSGQREQNYGVQVDVDTEDDTIPDNDTENADTQSQVLF